MKLFIAVMAAIALLGLVACTTTQQRASFNTIYSLQQATTAAFNGYLDSVIAGKTKTNSVPAISKKYNEFNAAALLALNIVEMNTNAVAPPSLVILSGDVINLITTLKGK